MLHIIGSLLYGQFFHLKLQQVRKVPGSNIFNFNKNRRSYTLLHSGSIIYQLWQFKQDYQALLYNSEILGFVLSSEFRKFSLDAIRRRLGQVRIPSIINFIYILFINWAVNNGGLQLRNYTNWAVRYVIRPNSLDTFC